MAFVHLAEAVFARLALLLAVEEAELLSFLLSRRVVFDLMPSRRVLFSSQPQPVHSQAFPAA